MPKLTLVAPIKFEPDIITNVPAVAEVGLNELIEGGLRNVKPAIDPTLFADVISIFPVAPEPTIAFMVVSLIIENEVAAMPPNLTIFATLKFEP